jgi:DNA-binding transcriptional ArsR family regulator
MPWRTILTKEMAEFLGVLAHPHRIRIVQELREGEMDVNGLQAVLEVSHSRVSQHLSVMRTNRIVAERRDGRHVFYRLVQGELPGWLTQGLDFLGQDSRHEEELQNALKKSKTVWAKESSNGAGKSEA